MSFPKKSIELGLFKKGYKSVYAVDEVGMGSLAGPVVVCAVKFSKNFYKTEPKNLKGLKDSKLLSQKQRRYFASQISVSKSVNYKICFSYPKTIDTVNIYKAARIAMKRAIIKLCRGSVAPHSTSARKLRAYKVPSRATSKTRAVILVDGPHKIPGLKMEQMPIIKGDRKVFAIACASILAKVFRDRMMKRYAKKYPGYGFETHKGYGTKHHVAQLASLGPSEIHRKSFAPVGKLV